MNSYEMNLLSAYADDDKNRPLKIESDYGIGNSASGHFSFDITAGDFHACTDVPLETMVEFAKWVLSQAQEGHQPVITQSVDAPVGGCEG